jgi:hypothetical protein
MSELFDDEEKELISEEDLIEVPEELIPETRPRATSDARRRLENLLDEKRLRDELEDFIDY